MPSPGYLSTSSFVWLNAEMSASIKLKNGHVGVKVRATVHICNSRQQVSLSFSAKPSGNLSIIGAPLSRWEIGG